MSATVEVSHLRKQLRNRNALLTGIFLQFVVLPFLGFAVVKALNMSSAMGITLLVVTSSPGGSYSNWWCSMFNADLALSVTMTAISTMMSVLMLPVNLVIYATSSYSGAVVKSLDWVSLFVSLVVVISAIGLGLLCSYKIHSHKFNLFANKLGNLAGISLVVFSALITSTDKDAELWDRDWKFYLGVASPCVLGLVIANMMTSCFKLVKPERVTVSVECCYQNIGIATSVAITMFEGDEQAEAIGVPLFYGIVEAVVLGIYCIAAWKLDWTKAPRDESFCVVIFNSYEVEEAEMHDVDAIEVVLGVPKDGLPTDLIFQFDEEEGYTIDDGSLITVSYPPTPEQSINGHNPAAGCHDDEERKIEEEACDLELHPVRVGDRLEKIISEDETTGSSQEDSRSASSPPNTEKPESVRQDLEISNISSTDSDGEGAAVAASPLGVDGTQRCPHPAPPDEPHSGIPVTPKENKSVFRSRAKGEYSSILLASPDNSNIVQSMSDGYQCREGHAAMPMSEEGRQATSSDDTNTHASAPDRLGRAVAALPRVPFAGAKSAKYKKAVALDEDGQYLPADEDQKEPSENTNTKGAESYELLTPVDNTEQPGPPTPPVHSPTSTTTNEHAIG